MKTLRVITIIACILVSIFFIVYAQIQSSYAYEARKEATELRDQAIALQQEAERAKELAIEAAAAAERAQMLCQQELDACKAGR